MNCNLYAQLLNSADLDDRICLETEAGDTLKYADVAQISSRLAGWMATNAIGPGDRVAAKVERSTVAIALYLAVLRIGAVYLPINSNYTSAETEYIVRDARPALLICDPKETSHLAAIAADFGCMLKTLDCRGNGTLTRGDSTFPSNFEPAMCGREDPAVILYTSGTTGRPKGAILTHGNLTSNALALANEWHYTTSDTLIHALPIYHIHGLLVACNVTFAANARILLMDRFDTERIIVAMSRATVLMGVPTFYVRLLSSNNLTPQTCRRMRLFISGAAPLGAETSREWRQRTDHHILDRYGMTETGVIASNCLSGRRADGSVGRALPGVQVRIADPDTGSEMPTGEVGLVEVAGPNVFAGYWNMPEKTASEFRSDGFFVTGDLGRLDPFGFLYLVGRSKDMIISGGLNVYPIEVESEIDAISGVVESAVIGLPHADFGEAVTAIIVYKGQCELDQSAIRDVLKNRIANFKIPKRIIFVDSLPRNVMGKVQKTLLRERFADTYQPST